MTIRHTSIKNVINEAKKVWNDKNYAHALTIMTKDGKYQLVFSYEEFPTINIDDIKSIVIDINCNESLVYGDYELGEWGEVFAA